MSRLRKLCKICFLTFFLLLVILGGIISLLPTIINTSWGKNQAITFINKRIPGTISAQSLSLSWLKGQTMSGVVLKDRQGQTILSIENLSTESTLWHLITSSSPIGASKVSGLKAYLSINPEGQTNLEEALSFHSSDVSIKNRPAVLSSHPLTLTNVNAQFSALSSEEPFVIHLTGQTKQDNIVGDLEVNIVIPEIGQHTHWWSTSSNKQQLLFNEHQQAEVKAKITNFPVEILDSFIAMNKPQLKGMLHELLGDHFNLTIDDAISQNGQSFDLNLTTPHVKGTFKGIVSKNEVRLLQPGNLSLDISPDLLTRISASSNAIVNKHSPVIINVNKASIPLEDDKDLNFDLMISTEELSLSHTTTNEQIALQNIRISLAGNSTSAISSQLSMTVDSPKIKALFKKPNGLLTIDTAFGLKNNHIAQIDRLNARFQSTQTDEMTLKVDPFQLNFHNIHLASIDLKGTCAISRLALESGIELQNLTIPWEFNAPMNRMAMKFDGSILDSSGTNSSPLTGNFSIENWLQNGHLVWDRIHLISNINFKQLPLAFFTTFNPQFDIGLLMGDAVDINLNGSIDLNKHTPSSMDVAINSPLLSATGKFFIQDNILSNQQPITANWKLTPQSWRYLRNILLDLPADQDSLQLNENTHVAFHINSMHLPLNRNTTLTDHGLTTELTIKQLNLADKKTRETLHINDLTMTFASPRLNETIDFTLHANPALNTDTKRTQVAVKGQVQHLFTPSGVPSLNGISCQMDVDCKEIPVQMIASLAGASESAQARLRALIGNKLNAEATVRVQRMTGSIQANLYGELGKAALDGQISNGILTLAKPLEIEVKVTPQLGQTVLNDFVPILSTAIHAKDPLKITVHPQNFSFPLTRFNIQEVKIPHLSMELGKINFLNEGTLKSILSILKIGNREQLTIWFTPLYVSLEDGLVNCQRIDMLIADEYPIALWGKVDLIQDFVKMTVGLSGPALQRAFGLKGLDSKYLMQLPLVGKTGNVRIDQAKAASYIAALIAQMQQGPTGQILGAVFEIAGNKFSDSSPPAPTTQPFPWEETKQTPKDNATDSNEEGMRRRKKQQDKTELDAKDLIKGIEKGASRLLDFLK